MNTMFYLYLEVTMLHENKQTTGKINDLVNCDSCHWILSKFYIVYI